MLSFINAGLRRLSFKHWSQVDVDTVALEGWVLNTWLRRLSFKDWAQKIEFKTLVSCFFLEHWSQEVEFEKLLEGSV